jgi:hypothetical protein
MMNNHNATVFCIINPFLGLFGVSLLQGDNGRNGEDAAAIFFYTPYIGRLGTSKVHKEKTRPTNPTTNHPYKQFCTSKNLILKDYIILK